MIYLFTGQPGSQKTANMLHFVRSDEQFKNRPVFYYNINSCAVEDWTELTEDEVKAWYDLPEGSVILIDEAQTIFRPQKWDKEKQRTVTELETHRHHGFDIVMTTQHPMLINTDVRRQVQQHRHYKKPYGLKSSALVWEKCVADPDDFHTKKEAEKISGKVPPEIFNLYKSTVLNTHKKRVPKKLVLFFVWLACLVVGIGWFAWDIANRSDEPESSASASTPAQSTEPEGGIFKLNAGSAGKGSSFQPYYPLNPEEYVKIFTPRIPDLPHTAPAYDELVKPTVAPKVRCYGYRRSSEYHCKCVTQQMTPVQMAREQCIHIVNNGMWDPAPVTSASYTAKGQRM